MIRPFFVSLGIALLAGALLAQSPPDFVAKNYPSLRVQGKVATKRNKVPGSSYRQIMITTPSITIESAPTQPMAAARTTCLIITMDTGKKYKQREEVYTVASNQTLDIPAVPKGQRREFEFDELRTEFDSERDYTNLGGDVYKYYVIAVFAENQDILHFETNCPTLEKYVKSKPDERTRFLNLKKGENFPTKFQ